MTNIIATIVIIVTTNFIAGNNEERWPHKFASFVGEPSGGSIKQPMTEKWEYEQVVTRTYLRFDYNGPKEVVLSQGIHKQNEKRWKKSDEWGQVK